MDGTLKKFKMAAAAIIAKRDRKVAPATSNYIASEIAVPCVVVATLPFSPNNRVIQFAAKTLSGAPPPPA